MGYDMYIEQADHTEANAYFRLNMWGMGRYARTMLDLGMVVEGYERGDWPELPDGLSWDDVETVRYPEDHEGVTPKPEAVAFEAQYDAYKAWHPEGVEGIACHKFGSNDGWLVTPTEIEKALAKYRAADDSQVADALNGNGVTDRDYWDQWIGFLERAQKLGGFRVH